MRDEANQFALVQRVTHATRARRVGQTYSNQPKFGDIMNAFRWC